MAGTEGDATSKYFENLAILCKAAAEGSPVAVLALKVLETQQLAIGRGLRTQIEIQHHRLILGTMTSTTVGAGVVKK